MSVLEMRPIAIGLVVAFGLAGALRAEDVPPPPNLATIHGAAFAAAKSGKWTIALKLAAKRPDPVADKLLVWLSLTSGRASAGFAEIAGFIERNPDWPQQGELRRRAEAALDAGIDDRTAREWFAAYPPLTGLGRGRLAELHLKAGDAATATALIREAWIESDFGARDEKIFYKRYRSYLRTEDHVARLDRLLWDRQRSAARRMYRRVDKGHRLLAEARMRLIAFAGGVDPAIARVPDALRDHPSLWYERLRWRRRKGFHDSAREILAAPPGDLIRPAAWWREARVETRQALREGLISVAYRFASKHRQTEVLPRAQAEWLAGWVALRHLSDAKLAYPHFETLHAIVRYPISVARGAYWAGRAAAASGDAKLAAEWYGKAARLPTTYYGQLASATLGRGGRLALPADPKPSAEDRAFIYDHELARAVEVLAAAGDRRLTRTFLLHLAGLVQTPGQHRVVAALAAEVGRADLGLVVARQSAGNGVMLIEAGYPMRPLPASRSKARKAEPALLQAMMRQESGFDVAAVSSAGALGLMQLMPATARLVAHRLGLPYDKAALTRDVTYNMTLGRAYIEGLLDKYDGSYVLAVAAYNAGPGRVGQFLRDFGDPRTDGIDVIDWVETIPLDETRNYVQRVLEAVPVYRHLLGQPTPADGLALDLARGISRPPS